MHEVRPSRSAVSAVICSSSRARQDRDSSAQSALVGFRDSGNVASAEWISSSVNPTVRAARIVGLTLEEIHAALATLPESRNPTKADWALLSRSWRARLDEQIAALTALRDGLTSCIGCGCLSLRQCALPTPGT